MDPPPIDLTLLRNGDQNQWHLAFQWLWPPANAKARFMMFRCCNNFAEDVAMESLGKLVDRVGEGKVDRVSRLKALLLRIVHDRAIDHCRKKGSATVDEPDPDLPDDLPDPLKEMELTDLADLLDKAAKQLKNPRDWEMIRDFYFFGYKYTEIAEKHGLAIGGVGTILTRALMALRKILPNEVNCNPDHQ